MTNFSEIEKTFKEVLLEYPAEFRPVIEANRVRIIWQVQQVVQFVPSGGRLLDVGAGIVPFMLLCQKIGYKVTIVDDFQDETCTNSSLNDVLELYIRSGVAVINANVFNMDLKKFENGSYDLVTSHDSMEHWHHSPKRLFHSLWSGMNKNGLFWLGVPNSVNLRKRITVPFGFGKWTQMRDWYEPEVFRGHVREPDVDDLIYIANDLGAKEYKVVGRNWIGYRNRSKLIRMLMPFADVGMKFFPSICSDIYLYAWKQAT